jgi:hypothetical protein
MLLVESSTCVSHSRDVLKLASSLEEKQQTLMRSYNQKQ